MQQPLESLNTIEPNRGEINQSQPQLQPQSQSPEPNIQKDDLIRILSEGTYGCILRPGMKCDNKQIESKNYITKIQVNSSVLQNEVQIGEIIRTIPLSNLYFATILSTCDVHIGEIENETIKKCEIIHNPHTASEKYVYSKIRYVGEYTLKKYFKSIYKKRPDIFLTMLIEMQIQLLESYKKIRDVDICHFDIKENNIMIDEINSQPVVIDFGMSFRPSEMTKDNFGEIFPRYDEYPPWCIDIFMMSQMKTLKFLFYSFIIPSMFSRQLFKICCVIDLCQ